MLKNSNARSYIARVYASAMVFLANSEETVQSRLSRRAEWFKYNPRSFIAGYQNRPTLVPSCELQPQHSATPSVSDCVWPVWAQCMVYHFIRVRSSVFINIT